MPTVGHMHLLFESLRGGGLWLCTISHCITQTASAGMVTCRACALTAESTSISHMHGWLRGGRQSLHGNAL